eukprot:4516836-Prymnesium_polylepis.1
MLLATGTLLLARCWHAAGSLQARCCWRAARVRAPRARGGGGCPSHRSARAACPRSRCSTARACAASSACPPPSGWSLRPKAREYDSEHTVLKCVVRV